MDFQLLFVQLFYGTFLDTTYDGHAMAANFPLTIIYTVRISCGDITLTMLQVQLCRDYGEFMGYWKQYYGTRLGIT